MNSERLAKKERRRPRRWISIVVVGVLTLGATGPASADSVAETILNSTVSSAVEPFGVAISPDGSRAYVIGPTTAAVSVIDTATNMVIETVTGLGTAQAVAVSPDGTRLYVTSSSTNTLKVIDTSTLAVTSILVGNFPRDIAISPDGSRVYVVNEVGNTISVIDTATDKVIATISGQTVSRNAVLSPDGTRLYVAQVAPVSGHDIYVYDTATNLPAGMIPVDATNRVREMVFTANGSWIYATSPSGNAVQVINPLTKMIDRTINLPPNTSPLGIAITPDGTRVYVTNSGNSTVSVIDTATNTVVGTPLALPAGSAPRGIQITPDGLHAYVATTGTNTTTVLDLDTFPTIVTTTVPEAVYGTVYPSTPIDVTGSPLPIVSVPPGALPPGLTFDPATRIISGTPTATGTFTFTVTASSTVSGIPSAVTRDYTIQVAPVAPAAPLDLTAALADDTSAVLAWTAPADDGGSPVTGYLIERSINGGPFSVLIADTASTATTYTDVALDPGTSYTYRVSALNSVGQSSPSNDATLTTPEAPIDTMTSTTSTTVTEPSSTSTSTTSTTVVPVAPPPPSAPSGSDRRCRNCPRPGPTPRRRCSPRSPSWRSVRH